MPVTDDSDASLDVSFDDEGAPMTVRSLDLGGGGDALWGDRPYEMPVVLE